MRLRAALLGMTIAVAGLLVVRHREGVRFAPPTIQVTTYLDPNLQRSPVAEGDPVCLTGVVDAIGKIKSVRAPGPSNARGWEVITLLDRRYQPKIPADSEVLLRM